MDIRKLLGKRLKELRKSKNLTQDEIAEKIDIDPKSVSNIETGKFYPTAENLEKILNVLEISPSDLFAFEYLASVQDLIDEMNVSMKQNEDLARLMYKFFKSVK